MDKLRERILFRQRLLLANAILLLALLGSCWGRHLDDVSLGAGDFLSTLRVPFRGWGTSEAHLTPVERGMLQPDSVLIRRYRAPDGRMVELAVIAGHRKRSIHTPSFCMTGGGWETLTQQSVHLSVPGGDVPATRALMSKGGSPILMTYFFTDGDYSSAGLLPFQGRQFLSRFRAQLPVGALVRVIVPVGRDAGAAEKLSDDFARTVLPPVMSALRNARHSAG